MARIDVIKVWPTGDALQVTVKVDTSYPDALAECKRTALDAFAEAMPACLEAES